MSGDHVLRPGEAAAERSRPADAGQPEPGSIVEGGTA